MVLQATGGARLVADCSTKPAPMSSGQERFKLPPERLAASEGVEMSVTTRLSKSENKRDGCRVVVAFTSESPRAILFPPSGSRLVVSMVAIARWSIVHLIVLPIFTMSTLC